MLAQKKPFENYPVSELQKRLYGEPVKYYPHDACCSGDRRKPIGHPGCPCLRWLREGLIK